jgi:hypothetical protein
VIFGIRSGFKSKKDLLDEEFERFRNKILPQITQMNTDKDDMRAVFKSYIEDGDYREAIDSGAFSDLNVLANGVLFLHLSPELRRIVPEYIKDNINLAEFGK